MVAMPEQEMGRFSVELELANKVDINDARRGQLAPEKVRKIRVRGVVDSGATRLVIPESVAKLLGLQFSGSTEVRYADGRKADRQVVDDIYLTFGDRHGTFTAIVESARESVLIGAIVMEELDLLIDCVTGRLLPRDPLKIISEVE